MIASTVTRAPPAPSSTPTRRPILTALVSGVTLAVSVAALVSPSLMRLLVRNLGQLEAGQWWRLVTPVFVQPDGWGQLVFNLLGIAVVGAALERRLGRTVWSIVYVLGGSGTVALYIVWHPDDIGGGSSAAVAAMIGALMVLSVAGSGSGRLEWFAQLYAVFFAVYLSALQFGGVLPSVIAGNASIIAVVVAHHTLRPSVVTRASLAVVVTSGVAMAVGRDDHGVGILVGVVIAVLVLAYRGVRAHPPAAGASAVVFDLLAPVVVYYGLRAAGVGVVTALVAGAVPPVVAAVVHGIRHRRLDALATTVVTLLALSAAVSVIAGSPRFLLAKDAALTAVWGIWFLLSLRSRRPLAFRFTRPLLEGRRVFDPGTRAWTAPAQRDWDALWERIPRFRRMWRVTTTIWAVAFLLDAVLRVAMAYALPVDDVPALAGALWLVTLVLLQIVTNAYLLRSGLWSILRGRPPTVPVVPSPPATVG